MSNEDLIKFLISLSYDCSYDYDDDDDFYYDFYHDDDHGFCDYEFPIVYEDLYQYSFSRRCFKLAIGDELSSRCECHIYKVVIHDISTCDLDLGPKCVLGKCYRVEYYSIVGVFSN